MKILHTSDWHLGITFNGYSGAEDQKHFLKQICSIVKERHIDAVLIAGDIFDRSIAGAEAIGIYDSIMTELISNLNVDVISIAGNHDGAERISQYHRILEKNGLYISGILDEEFTVAEYEDVDIFLLPWFTREKVKSIFSDSADSIKTTEDAFRTVCQRMKKCFNPDKKHILVSHAFITSAETSVSDRAAEVGFASAVSADVFEDFDYTALGHIHKPQIIRENIRYCGSPMAFSFGKEESQRKGVVIIDTDNMSQEFIEIEPLHKRTTLRGTFQEIMKADYPDEICKGYVRVEITDDYIGAESYAVLSERYPLLLEASGQNPDNDDAGITMTVDEFRAKADNPEDIFREYCREVRQECTRDRLDFFRKAMAESEGE